MKKIIISLIFSISIFSSVKSQELDSLQLESIMMFDSLLNQWTISKNIDTLQLERMYNQDHYIDISDSIIIERLKRIATPIQLSYTPEVSLWIKMYLKRGKYLIPTYLAMSDYYFPMFEKYLELKNVPHELKYLPIIESALNPRARSRAGATGIWQFMMGTGRLYGLEVNSFVDDRMDPEKASIAAANHLSDLYSIFNDWILAIAAYNCGAGNVRKAIARSGGKTNFWDIYKYLPRETRGYVPAFIAMTYIMNYAKEHNYTPAPVTLPFDTDTLMISDTLHLFQISSVLNIPIEQLRDLNPQYKLDIIPGFIKPYPLRLPSDKVVQFILKEQEIYAYADSVDLYNRLYVASYHTSYSRGGRSYNHNYSPCNDIDTRNLSRISYTVKAGESLSTIAQMFNVSLTELKCWNNLVSSRIKVGQKLAIYKPASKVQYYSSFDGMTTEQKQKLQSIQTKGQTSAVTTTDGSFVYYTIKSGESLYTIAQKFDGITHLDLMKINNFSSYESKNLKPGQVIKIKRK